MVKIIIVLLFLGILISLGRALFFLVKDTGETKKTVKSLTWRIGISIGLFILLILGVASGLIQPHGIYY